MVKTGSIWEFKNGWLMGNFVPSLVKTEGFEIAIHRHQAKTGGGDHIHKIATEYNIVVDGEVVLDHTISIRQNGYWITEPGQSFDVHFKEYTTLLVIKLPSVPDDKYPRSEAAPDLARFKDQEVKYSGPVSPKAKMLYQMYEKRFGKKPVPTLTPEQLKDHQDWLPSDEAAKEFFQKFPVEGERSEHEN